MSIISNILELAYERGFNDQELCKLLGLSKSGIYHWKNGKGEPSATQLIKLADHFGVTTDYLLTGNQDNLPLLNNENKVEPNSNYKHTKKVIASQKSAAEELGDAVIETLIKAGKINPDEQLTPELIESIIKIIDGIATFKI